MPIRAIRLALISSALASSAYGGAGFQIAGSLVEGATGEVWETEFQNRIAKPLGMTSSFYGHPLPRFQNSS